jgi:hypothetical protein
LTEVSECTVSCISPASSTPRNGQYDDLDIDPETNSFVEDLYDVSEEGALSGTSELGLEVLEELNAQDEVQTNPRTTPESDTISTMIQPESTTKAVDDEDESLSFKTFNTNPPVTVPETTSDNTSECLENAAQEETPEVLFVGELPDTHQNYISSQGEMVQPSDTSTFEKACEKAPMSENEESYAKPSDCQQSSPEDTNGNTEVIPDVEKVHSSVLLEQQSTAVCTDDLTKCHRSTSLATSVNKQTLENLEAGTAENEVAVVDTKEFDLSPDAAIVPDDQDLQSLSAMVPPVKSDKMLIESEDANDTKESNIVDIDSSVESSDLEDATEMVSPQAEDTSTNMSFASDTAQLSIGILEKQDDNVVVELMNAPPTIDTNNEKDDITAGLSLSNSVGLEQIRVSEETEPATEEELFDISVGPNNAAFNSEFSEDTELLKDFLSRAAASKASKAVLIERRESLEHRRDSDAIRHALASPRKVLEDKDPNASSPRKPSSITDPGLDVLLTKSQEALDEEEDTAQLDILDTASPMRRRSTRTRKSRIPGTPTSKSEASRITIRTQASTAVVSRRSEDKELEKLTSANTKRNKADAVPALKKLVFLRREAHIYSLPAEAQLSDDRPANPAGKRVVWDDNMAYCQDADGKEVVYISPGNNTSNQDQIVEPIGVENAGKPVAAPKIRRLGTPLKSALTATASLLPLDVQEEHATAEKTKLPKVRSRKATPRPKSQPLLQLEPQLGELDMSQAQTVAEMEAKKNGPEKDSVILERPSTMLKQRKSRLVVPRKVDLSNLATGTPERRMPQASDSLAYGRPVRRAARRVPI